MTVDAFLAWEERQELRHEFDGIALLAMTGGTFEHDTIQVNLIRALANRLAVTPCRVHGNSMEVEVMDSVRYPDAFVTCGPIPRGATLLRDPVVVFEVLSRGTARTDRMAKNREYAATASVRRYVMLEQGTVVRARRRGVDWPHPVRGRRDRHAGDRHRRAVGRTVRGRGRLGPAQRRGRLTMHPLGPWRVANLLIGQHGLDADLHAATRIGELWDAGGAMGAAVWR